MNKINDSDITFENIMRMTSSSISEKIKEFCEEYNYDISEVFDIFENKEYKALLYTDCVEHHVIKDEELKRILDQRLESDWE